MTETVRRPLVRPAFFRLSLVVFVLLVPMVVHAAWDYVETRRLRLAIEEIRGRGEPVTLEDIRTRPTKADGLKSDRYYRAAAVLASPDPTKQRGLFERVQDAERKGDWPAGLVEEMRRHLDEHEDALQLLDRAAPLAFEGFSPGTVGGSAGLFPLARLAGLRTWSRALDRDSGRATDSVYAELRLRPVVDWAWPVFRARVDEIDRVGGVLSATHPSPAELSRIGRALVDLDRDDGLTQWFLRRRAALFDSLFGPGRDTWFLTQAGFWQLGFFERLGRPWVDRAIRLRVETLSRVISALDQPWPQRRDAVESVYDRGSPPGDGSTRITRFLAREREFKLPDVAMSHQIVDDLALIRVARLAVAIEAYRRAHREAMPARLDDLMPGYLDSLPVDPYSGQRFLFHAEARTYAVYSVGPNRRDDSGDFTLLRFSQGVRESRDVGLRIQYR
ncbi:MAG: hypothetical protein ABJA98_27740 [Acidobacteriota bacterium]